MLLKVVLTLEPIFLKKFPIAFPKVFEAAAELAAEDEPAVAALIPVLPIVPTVPAVLPTTAPPVAVLVVATAPENQLPTVCAIQGATNIKPIVPKTFPTLLLNNFLKGLPISFPNFLIPFPIDLKNFLNIIFSLLLI